VANDAQDRRYFAIMAAKSLTTSGSSIFGAASEAEALVKLRRID
jgi:hypothetical protein